jgi:hypothetical protein
MGNLHEGRLALDRGATLSQRLSAPSHLTHVVNRAADELCRALHDEWESLSGDRDVIVPAERPVPERNWFHAAERAGAARFLAVRGDTQRALAMVATLVAPLERAAAGAWNYPRLTCDAADTLWFLQRTNHVDAIEHGLRKKVVEPDFRYANVDGRSSLARVCALQGRYTEAAEWFARARDVLDEQGARPLRAIVDFDEALMYLRRDRSGDRNRAAPLLDAAQEQFRAIGMTGWIRRADELRGQFGAETSMPQTAAPHREEPVASPATPSREREGNVFRREGDYWTISFDARTIRLKDAKGIHYLVHLLRYPGQEFHVIDLVRTVQSAKDDGRLVGAAQPLLDAQAKATYRRRLDELRDELLEAEANGDIGRATKARAELELISDELAAAVGLGGRDRPAGSDAERARLTVTKGIKSAIEKIRAADGVLGRHFATSIKTGYFCSYTPDPQGPGSWTF